MNHIIWIIFDTRTGFWWYDSRPRWNYGSIRLSIPNGHICECLHFLIHTDSIASKTSPTGIIIKTLPHLRFVFINSFCVLLILRSITWSQSNNFSCTIHFVIRFTIEVSWIKFPWIRSVTVELCAGIQHTSSPSNYNSTISNNNKFMKKKLLLKPIANITIRYCMLTSIQVSPEYSELKSRRVRKVKKSEKR